MGILPYQGKNPHGRVGNRTWDLMISQKRWPLEHEARLVLDENGNYIACRALLSAWIRFLSECVTIITPCSVSNDRVPGGHDDAKQATYLQLEQAPGTRCVQGQTGQLTFSTHSACCDVVMSYAWPRHVFLSRSLTYTPSNWKSVPVVKVWEYISALFQCKYWSYELTPRDNVTDAD
jgi:hypothetical protein